MTQLDLNNQLYLRLMQAAKSAGVSTDIFVTQLLDQHENQVADTSDDLLDATMLAELSFDFAFSMSRQPNGEFKRTWVTPSFERVTGFGIDEADERGGWRALIHPEDRAYFDSVFRRIISQGYEGDLEYRVVRKDGEIRYLWAAFRVVKDDEDQVTRFYVISRDISNEYRTQQAIIESEMRYRILLNSINDIVYTLDTNMCFTDIHGDLGYRYGLLTTEMLGKTQREIFGDAAGDMVDPINRLVLAGVSVEHEWYLQINNYDVYFHDRLTPLYNPADEIIGIAVVSRDATSAREFEKQQLEAEQLRIELEKEREFIELKERFMSMVSHEYRTPLSIMLATSNILDRYFDKLTPDKMRSHIRSLTPQIQYMTALMDDVLLLNRADAGKLITQIKTIQIRQFCRALAEKLRLSDGDQHQIVTDFKDMPLFMEADERILTHIFTNVLSNALKYSPAGSNVYFNGQMSGDGRVLFTLKDEGMGIPEPDQKRIFEPFHRAINAENIQGTGLGLSIVKRSVEAHGGTIQLHSEEGKGTTVIINLPVRVQHVSV